MIFIKKLYNSDDTFTIIFTQTTCGYCAQFKPVINEYAGDNNIPVYYLDIDTLDEDDSTNYSHQYLISVKIVAGEPQQCLLSKIKK